VPKVLAAAAPGDAVLWSPAFASFDQYPNFRARALEFHALLAAAATGGSPPSGTASGAL
jgi:UDP-N-acetylmuramoylalanine-D-glutamate ligase